MYIESAKLVFHIAHANSLKDKRQVRRSLIDKGRHKFNASIAEVAEQDQYRTLVIGISTVSGESTHAVQSLNEIIRFMEEQAEQMGVDLLEVLTGPFF